MMNRMTRSLASVAMLFVATSSIALAQKVNTISRANMDTTCAACADFYTYANGTWIRNAKVPASQTSLSSLGMLGDKNRDQVHTLLSEDSIAFAKGTAKAGSEQWKIGAYYASCMDTTAIDAMGTKPLQPSMDLINSINTPADLVAAFSSSERRGSFAPFRFGPSGDPKNSNDIILGAGQGGLSMPEREYYFRTDARSVDYRTQFTAHVARTLVLGGESEMDAKADADRIMALEMKLAAITVPRAQLRDPNASYHKMTLAEFNAMTPHINWDTYLSRIAPPTVKGLNTVNVSTPSYFVALDTLLTTIPISDWKAYLRWKAINGMSGTMGNAFANESFKWSQYTSGVQEAAPRWQRCYGATSGALGWAVGHQYVERYFTPEARARAAVMVDNLVSALRDRIQQLDWMSAPTKQEATVKLDAFLRKVAYPDTWRDYSVLTVVPGNYSENVANTGTYNRDRTWARVGKPVDRTEWSMTPPTVNASYSPSLNQIQFPIGILQSPFFDPDADDATNYGALGAVIGHEMSHGFDDQGRQFDAKGNLRDWWTPEDAAKYKAQAQLIIDQFNGYTVLDTMTHVNGANTIGENIGDFGGLTVAYAAMEKALAKSGKHNTIDGFTPEQRFFLSWAQTWREVRRPEAARTQVNTDVHSPSKWRVNGPLSNMPEFAKAFGCKANDKMVRPDSLRPRIW